MFKQALYTYWTSLHPRNLKYIIDRRWATFILLFVLLPDFREIEQYGVGAFYPTTIFLPIVVMKMSNLARKISIPKTLFLAPMKEEERRTYVKYLIAIKIGASMLLGFVIQVVWKLFYPISVLDIVICVFMYLSYGIAEYFCVEGTLDDGMKIEHGVRGANGKISVSSDNWVVLGVAMLQCMGYTPINGTESALVAANFMEEPSLIIILVIMLIFDIIIIVRHYKDMLNTVCRYEPAIKPEN